MDSELEMCSKQESIFKRSPVIEIHSAASASPVCKQGLSFDDQYNTTPFSNNCSSPVDPYSGETVPSRAYSEDAGPNITSSVGTEHTDLESASSVPPILRELYPRGKDVTILTPEHAFVQYQQRADDQVCQVCGQPAVGFHHNAYVCEACKKFFMRHATVRLRQDERSTADFSCPIGGNCRVEGPGRGKCPHCRFRKCLDLGMTLTPKGGQPSRNG